MENNASREEIAAAHAYQDLHVPALFHQFSQPVLAAIDIKPGQRVLDVACGTGVLAREAASMVGPEGYVAGLDPAPGMLAVAQELAPSIDWRQGAAGSIPFEDNSFDAVVSQFGLMFFPDRPASIREMLRVLASGGQIAVAVWQSLENSEAYPEEVALLQRMAGRPAADALRAPFVLGDQAALYRLFADAGVEPVDITEHHGTARFPSAKTMVEADLRGWLPIMGVMLTEDQIESILGEVEQTLNQYIRADGTVEFDAPAYIVTGRKR